MQQRRFCGRRAGAGPKALTTAGAGAAVAGIAPIAGAAIADPALAAGAAYAA